MISYLCRWIAASLIMPFLVLLFSRIVNGFLVLIFWPGSIVSMSLGAGEKSRSTVLYVWSIAIGLHILLYLCIGAAIYFLRRQNSITIE